MGKDPVWAVVPIKKFSQAKARLTPVLGSAMRRELASLMAEQVLKTVMACPEISGTLVVTSDPSAKRMADRLGARICALPSDEGVNAAVEAGFRLARDHSDRVLILPSDIPLATPGDLARLIAAGTPGETVRIVPDMAGRGTNALLLPSRTDFAFRFGENSAQAHAEAARRSGLQAFFDEIPRISRDIDTAEDLNALRDCDGAWLRFVTSAVTAN